MQKCVSMSLDGTAKDSSGTARAESTTVKDSSDIRSVKKCKCE